MKIGYSDLLDHLAEDLDQEGEDQKPVQITREDAEPVALIPATDLDALLDTVQPLRSRTNAERLLTSLARAKPYVKTPTGAKRLQTAMERDGT